jgi:hypothetical protein
VEWIRRSVYICILGMTDAAGKAKNNEEKKINNTGMESRLVR